MEILVENLLQRPGHRLALNHRIGIQANQPTSRVSLKEEFAVYGLPGWSFYAVGTLKLLSAALLIAGLWIPALACGAAVVMAGLMAGAVAMHFKVKDPLTRALPAFGILTLSIVIAAFYFRNN